MAAAVLAVAATTAAAAALQDDARVAAPALQEVAAAPTSTGIDLRFRVRGTAARVVVELSFQQRGIRAIHHQQAVVKALDGSELVSFHLRRLTKGASYSYTARAVAGGETTTVRGGFVLAGGASKSGLTGAVEPRDTNAILQGTVAPGPAGATAWFAWDESTNLRHSTPHRSIPGGVPASLVDSISGLQPGHQYRYRVVVRTTRGTTFGAVRTFRTTGATVGALPAPAGALTYVSTAGSDDADGSIDHPWRTLARAAAATPPGGTALVAPGSYAGFATARSGGPRAPITIQAMTAGTVHVVPAVPGSTIILEAVRYLRLIGLNVEGATGVQNAGIDILDGSSKITISHGTVSGNHSYGIDANGSTYVTIANETITGNDTGIRINRAGHGTLIQDNDVADNASMVVNDSKPGNDTGAVGISFLHTTGPVVARGNTIHGNRAQSDDYGYDGGAFEVYGASGVAMLGNIIWDNQDVLETGTDGATCGGNVFARNVAWGGNDKSKVAPRGPQTNGIILRCGQGMLIANNTFSDLDYWVYDITSGGSFSGGIDGFRILNNVSYQVGNKVYAIDTPLPAGAVIDDNVSLTTRGAPFASLPGKTDVPTIDVLRSLTGMEQHGRAGDPLFVNQRGTDFHLRTGSPAIGAGTRLPGVTGGYLGRAPDAGAYETG